MSSLWNSFTKAIGIGKMKLEKAADDAIDPVDAAKLQIKKDNENLQSAMSNLKNSRKDYYAEKIILDKAKNELVELQSKAQRLVANYRAQGLEDAQIAEKIKPIQEAMTLDVQKNKDIISTKEKNVIQLKTMVDTFESQIKQYNNKIKQRENQVKMLETRSNMVDTKEKIASAMTNLNIDGTADDLLKLEASIEAKEANALALQDHAAMNVSADETLDAMLLASASNEETDPFASLLSIAPKETKLLEDK